MGEEMNNIMLFAGGKQVGYSKDAKVTSTFDNADDSDTTFRNMSEKECHTMSFEMECDEKTKDFFMRMDRELKEKSEAIQERIESLFKEYFQIMSKLDEEKEDEARKQLLGLFAIGYKLGWNDYYHLNKEAGK